MEFISDILEDLELEGNSVVSQVMHMVEIIGGALSQEVPEGQVDPEMPPSGEGIPSSVPEPSGEDGVVIGSVNICSDNGQESREDTPKNPVNEQPAGREKEEEDNAEDEKRCLKDISQDLCEQKNHSSDIQISEVNVYNFPLPSCATQSPLPQHDSESVEVVADEVTSGELADSVPGPGSCSGDTASSAIEQEREEAGTEARDLSREAFVASPGSDHSGDDQNVKVLSGESSTAADTHPRAETQTHTPTSAPAETQTELSSFSAEAPTAKEPPETAAGPPTPSGTEEPSPVTKPSELETPAEPPGVEASPGVETTPASETGSVETTSQPAHPAKAETLPEEVGAAEVESVPSETPPAPVPESQPVPDPPVSESKPVSDALAPVSESKPASDIPAPVPENKPASDTPAPVSENKPASDAPAPVSESKSEPDTQPTPAHISGPDPETETRSEPEIDIKQEQASAPLEEKATSMEEAKQLIEKLMGVGPGHKEAGPNQNTPSKEPEEEEMEEDGAHGGAPEKGDLRSQGETHGEEKNHPNMSRYKTVSYRKIRKGNTKQRIDEFESIINT